MSIIKPPSQSAAPATLCPPPRTDSGRPFSRAKFTQATTSELPLTRAIRAGRLAIIAFQIVRASSYSGSAGCSNAPRNAFRSALDCGSIQPATARRGEHAPSPPRVDATTKAATSSRQGVVRLAAPANRVYARQRASARFTPLVDTVPTLERCDCGRPLPRAWRRRFRQTRLTASAKSVKRGPSSSISPEATALFMARSPMNTRSSSVSRSQRRGLLRTPGLRGKQPPRGRSRATKCVSMPAIGKIRSHAGQAGRNDRLDAPAHVTISRAR